MQQRLLNQDDIVQAQETQNRFNQVVIINPLEVTRKCGLLKDYKNLKDVTEQFIEFTGLNEEYDFGKGIFKRSETATKEDFGVIIKIGKVFYERQYDGYVLFDWFDTESLDVLVSCIQKYKHIRLSNKKYNFTLEKTLNINVNESFEIEGNQAEIEFTSNDKLESVFKLFFNKPIEYALFTNCKLKFNASTFVTSLRQSNCKYFDFYTENIFVDIDAQHISLTNGNIIDGLPANIQSQKIFGNIPEKKEIINSTDLDLLSVADLDTLSFVVNYVYCINRTQQNVKGQKTFKEILLPLATKDEEYCNMQNLENFVHNRLATLVNEYYRTKAKEINLELSGLFPEGSVYICSIDDKSPNELFGTNDNIQWTNLSEYLKEKLKINNFMLCKNKNRGNDSLYIQKPKVRTMVANNSISVSSPQFEGFKQLQGKDTITQQFVVWYKGDCTTLEIKE